MMRSRRFAASPGFAFLPASCAFVPPRNGCRRVVSGHALGTLARRVLTPQRLIPSAARLLSVLGPRRVHHDA